MARNSLKSHQKEIHSELKNHAGVVDSRQYAIWHNYGYQGLYELSSSVNATKEIARIKGIELKKGETPLNYMGAEELGINIYHITQAKAIISRGNHTPEKANEITFNLGQSIVKEIKARGNRPPRQIPSVEHIKEAQKRIKSSIKEKKIAEELIYACDGLEYKASDIDSLKMSLSETTVNNIWVIALFFSYFKDDGEILTSELVELIPKYYNFSDEDKVLSESTGNPKYIQKIKNIKSNKTKKTNPLNLGYFEDIKDGFKITQKGIAFVKAHFNQYL